MQAGLEDSTMWLGGACLVRVALVPCLPCWVNRPISRKPMGTWRGGNGQDLLQLGHSVCRGTCCPSWGGSIPATVGPVAHGDWAQGWPAGGDLQEGSFQLPAGTKPALKGSAAEGVCLASQWPQSSLALCRRGSRATRVG